MLTYEQATALPVVAKCERPDGYNGRRITASILLHDGYILELHTFGFHKCPAVSCAVDAAEVNWLIDNHPNFRDYRRVS